MLHFRFNLRAVAACIALVSAAIAAPAQAALQGGVNTGYTFSIAEDLDLLGDPSNMMLAKMAAWHTQHELVVARNMPYIELLNCSQTANITEFTLTIGKTAYNFDFAKFLPASSSPGITATVVGGANKADTVPEAQKGDSVQVNFTGLGPNEFARFMLDIDRDVMPNGDPYDDFRTVLFDMNGSNPNDNALLTVYYSDGTNQSNHLLDYGTGMTHVGFGFAGSYGMDSVQVFQLDGGTQQVPEPSSIVMLLMGTLGIAGIWFRKRMPPVSDLILQS